MGSDRTLLIYSIGSKSSQLDGFTLQKQIKSGIELSESMKFNYEIRDEGVLGDSVDDGSNRPVMKQLLEDVTGASYKDVYFHAYSCISRTRKGIFEIMDILRNQRVSVYFEPGYKIDFSNPNDVFLYSLFTDMTQSDSSWRSEKAKLGIETRIRRGKSFGQVPYGFTRDEEGLLIHYADEMMIYLEMVRLTLRNKTPHEISGTFIQQGLMTPKQSNHLRLGRPVPPHDNLKLWTYQTINRILRSTTYKGSMKTKHGIINVPPIISETIWDVLQDTIDRRIKGGTKRSSGRAKHEYLLKGLCRCRKCGGNMWGRKRQHSTGTIIENCMYCKRKHSDVKRKDGLCTLRSINTFVLEESVWTSLADTLSSPTIGREQIKSQLFGANEDERRVRVNALKREIVSISNQIDNNNRYLANLRSVMVQEITSTGENEEKRVSYKIAGEACQRQKIQNQFHLSLIETEDTWIDWISSFEQDVNTLNQYKSTCDRRPIIDKYVDVIWVDYDNYTKRHSVDVFLTLPLANASSYYRVENNKLERCNEIRKISGPVDGERCIRLEGLSNKHTSIDRRE